MGCAHSLCREVGTKEYKVRTSGAVGTVAMYAYLSVRLLAPLLCHALLRSFDLHLCIPSTRGRDRFLLVGLRCVPAMESLGTQKAVGMAGCGGSGG